MSTFPVSQLLDKTVYLNRQAPAFDKKPDLGGKKIFIAKAGVPIGKLYSYVYNKSTGKYWWEIETNLNHFFIEFDDTLFNKQKFIEQGALTTEQIRAKEEWENADIFKKIQLLFSKIGPTIKTLLFIGVIAWGTGQIIKATKK